MRLAPGEHRALDVRAELARAHQIEERRSRQRTVDGARTSTFDRDEGEAEGCRGFGRLSLGPPGGLPT